MDKLLSRLTGEQALEVVRRLAGTPGAVAEAVLAEAKKVLAAVDIDEIADEVFWLLDSIDVQDCWDRSGASRGGYTSPDEAATELIEEELQPFFDQADRYHDLQMAEQERDYCMGVVLGTYRYEQESKSEFKDWCEDMPLECAGCLLDTWRERVLDASFPAVMDEFVGQRCPRWAEYLIRK